MARLSRDGRACSVPGDCLSETRRVIYASHYFLPLVWRLTTSALDESESVSCREWGYALPGLYSN